MQRSAGAAALEPIEQRRDTEFTLGPAMLALLGCGLFALCTLCFTFGYAVGRRGPGDGGSALALPGAGGQSALQAAGTQSKPSATQNSFQPQAQRADAAALPVQEAEASSDGQAGDEAVSVPAAHAGGGSAAATGSDSVLRTALPVQPVAGQPVTQGGKVEPALAQSIMVQIAAVSHPEDADVLVSALKKHGYAVSARRDPADGLLHVQVGPFANRSDAAVMRQKLLNDGYNAIVQ